MDRKKQRKSNEIIQCMIAGSSKDYSKWSANIVSVPNKDENVCMCLDYRDLNKASPKDDFPLPHIDVHIDNTAVMLCSLLWTDFLVTTKLTRWLKTVKVLLSLLLWNILS